MTPPLREQVRAILREELEAPPAQAPPEAAPGFASVRIASSADLLRFAQELVARAANPDFAARVMSGQVRFALEGGAGPLPSGAGRPAREAPALDKNLVTERDIAELGRAARSVRLSGRCRLTPLARDEARRIGLRIERIEE